MSLATQFLHRCSGSPFREAELAVPLSFSSRKQSQPAMTAIASYAGTPSMLAQSYAAGPRPPFGAHVRRTAHPPRNEPLMHLAMPQANGNSLRWAVPQATPPRRRARPCHALAQPVLDVASAPVLVFMIGRAVTAGDHQHRWQVQIALRH